MVDPVEIDKEKFRRALNGMMMTTKTALKLMVEKLDKALGDKPGECHRAAVRDILVNFRHVTAEMCLNFDAIVVESGEVYEEELESV